MISSATKWPRSQKKYVNFLILTGRKYMKQQLKVKISTPKSHGTSVPSCPKAWDSAVPEIFEQLHSIKESSKNNLTLEENS